MDSRFWCGFWQKNPNILQLLEVNLHERLKPLLLDHYHSSRSRLYILFNRHSIVPLTYIFMFFLFNFSSLSKRSILTVLVAVCLDPLTLLSEEVIKSNYRKNLFFITFVYFSYTINNWSSTKIFYYFSSTIFSTTIWINNLWVTIKHNRKFLYPQRMLFVQIVFLLLFFPVHSIICLSME